MEIINTKKLKSIIEKEFAHIVDYVEETYKNELRVYLIDGSFIKFWFSLKFIKRYSYHWERRKVSGKIYRHDNSPHLRWKNIKTYPKHFHNEKDDKVEESYISNIPETAIREMLKFVDKIIKNCK